MTVAISFTGEAKRLILAERDRVEQAVEDLKVAPDLFFSGAARGVDVWAAECAIRYWPESKHIILVPQWKPTREAPPIPCVHDRTGISRLAKLAAELGVWMEWRWADPGAGDKPAVGYLRRNDILATNCTHMLAFPRVTTYYRSGTWATINRAVKMNRPVKLVPLDGGRSKRL